MSVRKMLALAISGGMLLVSLVLSGKVVENVDANEIVVIQDPVDGELSKSKLSIGLRVKKFGPKP